MQENNPINSLNQSVSNSVIQTEQQPKQSNFLTILLSVLLIVSVAIAGFFAFQTQKLVAELRIMKDEVRIVPAATTEPVVTKSSELDPTINWKTFSNKSLKWTFKYPNDWTNSLSESNSSIDLLNIKHLVIYKGDYKINIDFPDTFGPSICVFDDESKIGVSEMASFCEGKYVEIKSSDGKILKRRLEKPQAISNGVQWAIYTKSQNNFVTLPPTNYEVPEAYDVVLIKTMDQILSTFKFLD